LTQGDIDKFVSIYGHENPSEAVSSVTDVSHERLNLVVRRLANVYVMKGQHEDEESMLKRLAEIQDNGAVSPEEYNLYQANDSSLKPVFVKYLGDYTLRLPNSVADRVPAPAAGDEDPGQDQAATQASNQTPPDAADTSGQGAQDGEPMATGGTPAPSPTHDPAEPTGEKILGAEDLPSVGADS
jgi:hypothetical protein